MRLDFDFRPVERLLSSVRYDPVVYVILMKEYYALGWTKKEKYSHSKCRQPESNLVSGGSGNPTIKPEKGGKSTWKSCEVSKTSELRGIVWDDSRGPTELFGPLVPSWHGFVVPYHRIRNVCTSRSGLPCLRHYSLEWRSTRSQYHEIMMQMTWLHAKNEKFSIHVMGLGVH